MLAVTAAFDLLNYQNVDRTTTTTLAVYWLLCSSSIDCTTTQLYSNGHIKYSNGQDALPMRPKIA